MGKKMEDPNMLAADCIVICTCCPCLIIQVLAVIFIRLPQKLARKAVRAVVLLKRSRCSSCFLKRKNSKKKRMRVVNRCKMVRDDSLQRWRWGDPINNGDTGDFWKGGVSETKDFSCPIEAADEVFKELYDLGVLGFGDFDRGPRHEQGGHNPEPKNGPGTCVWVAYS